MTTDNSSVKHSLHASILSGGIGSRFWPFSRETTPKQILSVAGEESLLKSTIKRLAPLVAPEKISIVTNTQQAAIIRHHLGYSESEPSPGYVIEPTGRNTAPAIGLAALRLIEEDPEAIMAVLPADHLIKDGAAFRAALLAAGAVAEDGHLVTFGVTPSCAETGYGYIKAHKEPFRKEGGFKVLKVEKFVEKPDKKRAERYLAEGGYFWNSGIFVWKAQRVLEEMSRHIPGIYSALMEIKSGADITGAYSKMEPISIDHGVLEKTDGCVVIEANFPWSDMGSWNSLGDIFSPDIDGNIKKGRVVDIDSKNSTIIGSRRVVATIGLTDMIVIDTPDATMICPKEKAQDVKELVVMVKKKGWTEHEIHPTVEKPWGSYSVIEEGKGFKVKSIRVGPGKRLSLQSHKKRSEHWIVVAGRARVQLNDEVMELDPDESAYIPKGAKHRLENRADEILEIIEVQNGEYLGEDDITRYGDDFGRS